MSVKVMLGKDMVVLKWGGAVADAVRRLMGAWAEIHDQLAAAQLHAETSIRKDLKALEVRGLPARLFRVIPELVDRWHTHAGSLHVPGPFSLMPWESKPALL